MATYDVYCRPCGVRFKIASDRGDAKCPACEVMIEGGVLDAFLNYELCNGVVTEAIAEIRRLPDGRVTAKVRHNLIEHLRASVRINEVPDGRFSRP